MPSAESQACGCGSGFAHPLYRGNKEGNGRAVTLVMNYEMGRIDIGIWKTVNYYELYCFM
jgi:hypothetical protein